MFCEGITTGIDILTYISGLFTIVCKDTPEARFELGIELGYSGVNLYSLQFGEEGEKRVKA